MTLKESVDLLTPIADSGALYAIGKNGKEALRAVLSALAGKDQRCSNCERLREERDALAAQVEYICDELEDDCNVTDGPGGPRPNRAMRLRADIHRHYATPLLSYQAAWELAFDMLKRRGA
jgi:hypothetical protein